MTAKSITIVSHFYSPPGCDLYVQHLKWQAASLLNNRPHADVLWKVFTDQQSAEVIADKWHQFRKHAVTRGMAGGALAGILAVIEPEKLLRRSIGRNIAAKHLTTDVVWFCDLDYCFGDGCIDAVVDQVDLDDGLRFPREVLQNVDHETGDRMIEEGRHKAWPQVDPSLFTTRRRQFAIGGLQIVGGNTARRIGYLPDTKWQKPVDPKRGWHQTQEDRIYRAEFDGSKAIDVPNLYWLRHTVKGADLDGAGTHRGKEVW
jgi:hypothetical protein